MTRNVILSLDVQVHKMASKRISIAPQAYKDKLDETTVGLPKCVPDKIRDFVGPCTISAIKDSLAVLHKQAFTEHCLSHQQLQPYKLPPIGRRSKKEDIKNAIRSLPSDWVPNKKKSKVIERLMKKKEADHEATMEAMRGKMTDVNVAVEEDIRLLASIYKVSVADGLNAMDESLKNLRAAYKKEGQLAQNHFDKAIEGVAINYRLESRRIYVLTQKLKLRETHRIEQFKTFLQIAYKRAHEIAFKTPFQIEEFFTQEIQDINEITLNNLRVYQSLRMKLSLNLENEARLRYQEIQAVKLNWINYIKLSVFSSLNEQSLFGEKPPEKTGEKSTAYKLDPLVVELIHSPNMPELNVDQLYEWINKVQSVINQIDWCARDIIGTFKSAVIVMFKSYFSDMKEIADRILNLGVVGDKPDDPDNPVMRAEICCPAIADLGRRFQRILKQLQTMWDNISGEVHKELQTTFVFLNTFANLWETHIARVNEAKDLVLKDVRNCMNTTYLDLCNEEVNINILTDTLRQEPVESNLDADLANGFKRLDTLGQVYNANYEKECKVVKNKLMDLINCEGELHYAEITNFLATTKDMVKKDGDEANEDDEADTITILEKEINLCDSQLENIKDWRTRLHSTITDYLKIAKEENVKSATVWIEQECEKFDVRKRISIDILHKSRYNRPKPVLYELRFAELREHTQRFERHRAAVEKEAEEFPTYFAQCETLYDKEMETFLNKSNEIKEKLPKLKNGPSVLAEMIAFKTVTDRCVKNLTSMDVDFKKKCNDNMARIVKSNLNYITSMKSFEEGGNFNTEEIKTVAAELAKIEKATKKKLLAATKQGTKKLQKCLGKTTTIQNGTGDMLSKYKSELGYQDLCANTLKDVHADIKREVYALRQMKKSTFAWIDDIKEYCGSSFKDDSDLYEFQKQMRILLLRMSKLKQALSRPAPEIDGSFGKLGKVQKTSAKTEAMDVKSLLFPFEPPLEPSFLGKCRYLLYKSFSTIQKASKDFYEANKTGQFITKDKVLPTYNDFISETLPKYIYYYVQCELLWLEEMREFMDKIDEVTAYIQNYSAKSLKQYTNKCMTEITNIHKMISKRLEEVNADQKEKFWGIHKKLLALHGHPSNKLLLDELCDEMNLFLEERKDLFIPSMECCTCDLEDMQRAFSSTLAELDQMLARLSAQVFERSFKKEINEEYAKGQLFIEDFISSNADDSPANKKSSLFRVASLKLDNYRSKVIIPPEYKLSAGDPSGIIDTFPLDASGSSDTTKSITDLPGAISSYEAERLRIVIALQAADKTNLDRLDEWKKLWDTEVEQVKKLYTVKYDLVKQ